MTHRQRLTTTCLLAALTAATTLAVPARRGVWRNMTLADGSTRKALLQGDEHCCYFEDAAGQLFARGNEGRLEVISRDRVAAHQAQWLETPSTTRRPISPENLRGQQKGLIILVNFKDKSFEEGHDQAFFNRFANERGFSEGRYRGSVKDYFIDQSLGQFEIDFDVVGPYTLSHNMKYYGEPFLFAPDINVIGMITEACELADPDVNYADYDWDGDGVVEQVFVIYAGLGEADGGDENTVWPQESSFTRKNKSTLKLDGVEVDTYACSNELSAVIAYDENGRPYYSDETYVCGIGTTCHEFSHCLGFPDTYDKVGSGFGMGAWDIMSSGNYLDDGYSPCAYTGYERWVAGWLEPIELTDPVAVKDAKPLAEGGDTYIVYLDNPERTEYLLLDNRQKTGWDSSLRGRGLLITHVDYKKSMWNGHTVNNNKNHQRMTIFHADNDTTSYLQSYVGDPYPYDPVEVWTPYLTENYPTVDEMIDHINERYNSTYTKQPNNSLTSTSVPALFQYNGTHAHLPVEDHDITDITQNADGTMSFSYRGGTAAIGKPHTAAPTARAAYYTADGKRLTQPQRGLNIVRRADGTTGKYVVR